MAGHNRRKSTIKFSNLFNYMLKLWRWSLSIDFPLNKIKVIENKLTSFKAFIK